ncbi:hypothetical protein BYT27DRAFT_6750253 [Phlegmacium glaucopus]|nr:hypothetical protein BYT27DRAFT_6750253 [Phlegmacium glaucopus]
MPCSLSPLSTSPGSEFAAMELTWRRLLIGLMSIHNPAHRQPFQIQIHSFQQSNNQCHPNLPRTRVCFGDGNLRLVEGDCGAELRLFLDWGLLIEAALALIRGCSIYQGGRTTKRAFVV